MATTTSPQRKKGPQKPSRYPIPPGQRYKIWGEQPGFIYNPYQDKYIPDVEGQAKALQDSGVIPKDPEAPKSPDLADQLLPLAGVALANKGSEYLGTEILGPGIKGLFGLGDAGASAAPKILNGIQVTPNSIFSSPGIGASNGPAGMLGIGQGGFGGPALGAFGAYDLFKNDYGPGRGALQGAASGAAMGSYFGLPGTAIGAGIGGLIGLGKSIMNRGYSDLEDQKRKELAAMGINVQGGDGAWERNADFAKSRDESKLLGTDILDAADWRLKFGDRWDMTDRARQVEIANEAIKRGLVREHNGGIDINTGGLSDFVRA